MTGGFDDNRLSSTEILVSGAISWIYVGNLPLAINGLVGVSFQNKIMMTGK